MRDVLHHGPQESEKCVRDHPRRLSGLSPFEVVTDRGLVMITSRGLHQHMATVTVAGVGNPAAAYAVAARVFARDEPKIRGELRGPCEPAPIHQFRREPHRVLQGDSAKAS